MSVFVIVCGKPILILNNTRYLLKFVIGIFQQPFCLAASPTCHRLVPFGRPRHKIQGWSGLFWNVGMVIATDCRVRQAEEKVKDHPWILCLGLPNGTSLW